MWICTGTRNEKYSTHCRDWAHENGDQQQTGENYLKNTLHEKVKWGRSVANKCRTANNERKSKLPRSGKRMEIILWRKSVVAVLIDRSRDDTCQET
jgi:hypothetical protein